MITTSRATAINEIEDEHIIPSVKDQTSIITDDDYIKTYGQYAAHGTGTTTVTIFENPTLLYSDRPTVRLSKITTSICSKICSVA